MMYSRFTKYLAVLKNNKRAAVRTLYSLAAGDVKTLTRSNVRKIILNSGMDPRQVHAREFANWRVYTAADDWSVPLITSLLELRADAWTVNFDLEEEECLEDPEINFMLEAVCTG